MVNSDAQTNGETAVLSPQPAAKDTSTVDYIELDEEDDDVLIDEEPPTKKQKPSANDDESSESKVEPPTSTEADPKAGQLSNYTALLDRLEEHIQKGLTNSTNADRKLLDTLLGAINVQVQKEPYSVRKLILDKQLVLPNSISFPPSQVVDLTIEHDADVQISKVLTRIFGDERPKLSDAEKRERQSFKNTFPAPAMTRMLMEIGQDLVQETTYSDIVHAKNLPEMPKNVETYKQVAAQLKPVWENLRDKNASFKLKTYTCKICEFKTENMLLMSVHKQTFHISDKKIQCGMCSEYNTNGSKMNRHYIERHGLVPLLPEDPPSKIQCPLCEADFQFKGQRDAHMKTCKREVSRLMSIQASRMPEHSAMINRWLWSRPPADPTIQQDIQRQQAAKLQQQRVIAPTPRITPTAPVQSKPAVSKTPQSAAKNTQSPNVANMLASMLANQQFQNQLKNLGPAQQKQLEQLLQSKSSQVPANVVSAIQSQLRNVQSQSQQQAATSTLAKTLAQAGQLNSLSQMSPQMLQQLTRTLQAQQQSQQSRQSSGSNRTPVGQTIQRKVGGTLPTPSSSASRNSTSSVRVEELICEICDEKHSNKGEYLGHLKNTHNVFRDRSIDLDSGPPLACSRCRERFWSYEGLERHLVMIHSLVTADLLQKAQNKTDGGRCKKCSKSFAFNILQHLATDHEAKLCSAEILFSCDVCPFKCSSYTKLEEHLNVSHPKTNGNSKNGTQ